MCVRVYLCMCVVYVADNQERSFREKLSLKGYFPK